MAALEVTLRNELLALQASGARLEADHHEAALQEEVDKELHGDGLISEQRLKLSKARVQELAKLNPSLSLAVTFVPHLIPMNRGILSTCYARLAASGTGIEDVRRLYKEFYRGEPFVKVVDVPPQTKQTWGSNLCFIHPVVDGRTGRLIVISCIDNLVKGGAGQAVQNMNVMLGMPEAAGLDAVGVYP